MSSQDDTIEVIFPDVEILVQSLNKIGTDIIEKNQDEKKLMKIIEILKKTCIEAIKKIPNNYYKDENKKKILINSIETIEELLNSKHFTESKDIKVVKLVMLTRESINSIEKIGLNAVKVKSFYPSNKDEKNSSSFIKIIFTSLHQIGIYAAQKKFDNIAVRVIDTIQNISNSAFDNDLLDIIDILNVIEIEFPFIEKICTEAISHDLELTIRECAYVLQGIGSSTKEMGKNTLLKNVLELYNIIGSEAIRNNISTKMDILSFIKTIYMESLFKDFDKMIFSSYNTFMELSYQNNLDEVIYTIKDDLHEMRLAAVKKNNIEIINKIDYLLKNEKEESIKNIK